MYNTLVNVQYSIPGNHTGACALKCHDISKYPMISSVFKYSAIKSLVSIISSQIYEIYLPSILNS